MTMHQLKPQHLVAGDDLTGADAYGRPTAEVRELYASEKLVLFTGTNKNGYGQPESYWNICDRDTGTHLATYFPRTKVLGHRVDRPNGQGQKLAVWHEAVSIVKTIRRTLTGDPKLAD